MDQFKAYLSEKSEVWQNRTDDSPITIIIMACDTGRSDLPAEMSKEANVTVIAADAVVQMGSRGEGFKT